MTNFQKGAIVFILALLALGAWAFAKAVGV